MAHDEQRKPREAKKAPHEFKFKDIPDFNVGKSGGPVIKELDFPEKKITRDEQGT